MTTPTHLRSLYRRLLRELPSLPTTRSTPLHTHLRKTFIQATTTPVSPLTSAILSDSTSASSHFASSSGLDGIGATKTPEEKLEEAEELVRYLRAQRMYITLVERYNPGMDMTEEERVRLTARRVGMDLPVDYEK